MRTRLPAFVVALLSSLSLATTGCTVGQTRFALGATLAADATTTQAALSSGGEEANPVLKSAPVPIMLVLSAVVALVAEKHVRDGSPSKAKTLYTLASVVHGAAAAWNGYQLGRGGGASLTATSARPALPGTPAGGGGPRSLAAPRRP